MSLDKNKIICAIQKPYAYAIIFTVLLMSLNVCVLCKTYLISSVEQYVETTRSDNIPDSQKTYYGKTEITDSSYTDDNISINIQNIRKYESDIHIAEIKLSSAEYLKTALANNAFGTNVTQKTSEMAKSCNAILAINGDYYGANQRGYVIKNSILYRDSIRRNSQYDDLIINSDGKWELINESDISAQQLINMGAVQSFAFGPALIKNGRISVSEGDEVGKAMAENPRTVIGKVDDLHYIFMVSDGRTDESSGISLYQAAEIMQSFKCIIAYNLDGGGSSAMFFNGEIINNPTTNGKRISERAVSDIVYIGY